MALARRPDCGGKISTEARACPHCGRPATRESALPFRLGRWLRRQIRQVKSNPLRPPAGRCPQCSNVVPVGQDQKQHVEVTRDVAIKFNELYGTTFVVPEPRIQESTAKVPGTDGEKMSKSLGNTIEIFGDEKLLRKKVMSIVMDSRTPAEPKPDADRNLAIQLLKLVAPAEVAQDFEDRLRAGGLGYGDLKKSLFEHYWNYFADARALASYLKSLKPIRNQVPAMTGASEKPSAPYLTVVVPK